MDKVNEATITAVINLEDEHIILKVDGATFRLIPFADYKDYRNQIHKPMSPNRIRHAVACEKIESALKKLKLTPEDIDNYKDRNQHKMGKFKDLLKFKD